MLSPLFSTAEFLKRIILISLPQQTKGSQIIHVSSGQRSETGTFKILSPFHIQSICLSSNLGCLPSDLILTWFHITREWQFCFTASWFIIFHLESFFHSKVQATVVKKKDYVFVNVFLKVDHFNAFPSSSLPKTNWRAGSSHDLIFWMHCSPAHPLAI